MWHRAPAASVLLRAGLDVDGCDVSEDMLALCREAAAREGLTPTLYAQAMHELDLPRRYRTIVVCGGLGLGSTEKNFHRRLRWARPREQPGTGPRVAATPPRTPRAGRRPRARQRGAVRRRRAVAVLAEGESVPSCLGRESLRERARSRRTARSTSCVRGSSASTLWPSRRRWRCRPSCGETKSWSPRKSTC